MEKIQVDELLKKINARYVLVNIAIKRAQEMLIEHRESMKASEIINKVFQEIIQDKITVKKEKVDESEQGKSK